MQTKLKTLVGWTPKYDDLEFIIKNRMELGEELYLQSVKGSVINYAFEHLGIKA
jgi:hypothetical protein